MEIYFDYVQPKPLNSCVISLAYLEMAVRHYGISDGIFSKLIGLKLSVMVVLIFLGFAFKIIDPSYITRWLPGKQETEFEQEA